MRRFVYRRIIEERQPPEIFCVNSNTCQGKKQIAQRKVWFFVQLRILTVKNSVSANKPNFVLY